MKPINPMWNKLHMVLEFVIAVGFFLGLIPFLYAWVAGWIIPLTIISFIFSIVLSNGTIFLTITNFIMAILSVIPIIGYIPRIIGIIISIINMVVINNRRKMY